MLTTPCRHQTNGWCLTCVHDLREAANKLKKGMWVIMCLHESPRSKVRSDKVVLDRAAEVAYDTMMDAAEGLTKSGL